MEGNIDSRTVLDTLGLAGSTQTLQLMRCLLARNAADALALFDRLYRGGKDVAALLGELSDLARDMTVMKAAPEGRRRSAVRRLRPQDPDRSGPRFAHEPVSVHGRYAAGLLRRAGGQASVPARRRSCAC